jgi:hypothetical protein
MDRMSGIRETEGQLLVLFSFIDVKGVPVAAPASGDLNRDIFVFRLLAAVGGLFLHLCTLFLQSFLPAAARMAGTPVEIALAERAFTDTFPVKGAGDGRIAHGKGHKGAHDDHRIDRCKE